MSGFDEDFRWQMQFVPSVLEIIRPVAAGLVMELCVAPRERDIKQNADLLIVPFGGKDIAMRLRRPGYLWRYGLDVTIRSLRDSGAETELSKIRRGLGDMFFYGHVEREWSS